MSSSEVKSQLSVMIDSPQVSDDRKKPSSYVPGEKCGKWSQEEHMKYIVFIDYNKEKMRSKQKRRSNKFYEEMARFIRTRNSLQCRSHHQKLEEKYTHVNKIIALYKNFFNKSIYRRHLEQLQTLTHQKNIDNPTRYTTGERPTVDAEVQTDIRDLNNELKIINPNLVVIQRKSPSHPMQVPQHQSPPIFYPHPHYPMQMMHPQAPFSYPMGWWPGYPHH